MLQISITLSHDATDDDAKKAISTIGWFLGADRMASIANGLMGTTAAAPIAPPPPAPIGAFSAAPPEFDSTGLPWDERIHSDNKTKNQDGSWKARKGVGDATKLGVTAELRARHPAAAPLAPPPPANAAPMFPPGPAAPPPPPNNDGLDLPAALVRPAAPPPPPAAADNANTFIGLMQKITGGIQAGKLNQAQVVEACKSVGLDNAAMLGNPANAHQIPAVAAYIDALLMS